MKSKTFLLSLFLIALGVATFSSCDNTAASLQSNGFTLQGKLENAQNITAYFDQISFDKSNTSMAKAEIDGSGKFEFHLDEMLTEGIYRLRIGARKAFFYFDGNTNLVKLNGSLNSFDKYDFKLDASEASQDFQKAMQLIANRDFASLETYLKEGKAIPAAFIASDLYQNNSKQLPLFKSLNDRLNSEASNSTYATIFGQLVQNMEAKIAAQRATELVQVGKPAPEIRLSGPDGQERALSDLKGKIVLLDFWASWCGPCRRENPKVVETYKKYKEQGFTVFSVSLDGVNPRMRNKFKTEEDVNRQQDQAKKKWVDAIAKDNLIWDSHVSDLKHWNSIAAKTYGVRSIPQTFLIDRDGNIAALNPRHNLEEELKKLL